MAASIEQKLDFLLKKIGYVASKTGIAEDSTLSGTKKAPFGEAIPSPLVVPESSIWAQANEIPATPPGSDTSYVRVYLSGSSGHRMTVDNTVSGNRTFIARSTYNDNSSSILGDWIDTSFGADYIIEVYKGDPNSGGVKLSAAGSGSNDTWFFDYSSGVLNFNGTVVPSGVTSSNIYIVGYRYIGIKGVAVPGAGATFTHATIGDLNVTGVSTFFDTTNNTLGDENTGSVQLDGGMGIAKNLTVKQNLHVGGYSEFVGVATFKGGTINLGDADTDDINIGGEFVSDLIPDVDDTYSLGSSSKQWKNLFINGHAELDNTVISGVSTFSSPLDINTDVDIDGHTELDNVNIAGVTTFQSNAFFGDADYIQMGDAQDLKIGHAGSYSVILDQGEGNLSIGGDGFVDIMNTALDEYKARFTTNGSVELYFDNVNKFETTGYGATVFGTLQSQQLNVTGVSTSTYAGDVDFNGHIDVDGHTELDNVNISGIVTAFELDVDGQTQLDDLNVAGVSTYAGDADFNGHIDVDGHTELDNVNVSGIITAFELDVEGHTELDNVNISGVTTTGGLLDINAGGQANTFKVEDLTDNRVVIAGTGGELEDDANLTFNGSTLSVGVELDVDGHTELDNLAVSGVSTFTGAIDANGDLDVDGHTELDNVNVSGVSTFVGVGTFNSDVFVAGDLNVIGNVVYTQASATNLEVTGISTLFHLNVDGHTDLDNVDIAGVTTTSGLLDINAGGQANTFKVEDLTDNRVVIAGTGGELEDDANLTFNGSTLAVGVELDVDGHTELDNVAISGVSTFTGNIDANGDLDVDGTTELDVLNVAETATFSSNIDANGDLDVHGHAELDELRVSGVSTFVSSVDINADIDVDGHTNLDNVDIAGVTTTSDLLDINAGGQANTFKVEDLTDNRVVIAGTGGELEDDANLTFNGTQLFVGVELDVDGHTELDNVNVSGIATVENLRVNTDFDVYDTQAVFHNNVHIDGNLSIGGTTTVLQAQDLKIFDKDLILGVTTDAQGNDISTDITANHGGVAVASTTGNPLVNLTVPGLEELPSTYKKIMWFQEGAFSGLGTDAWLINYAVGIGSTQFPTGTRLAVGGIQFSEDTITTPNITISEDLSITGDLDVDGHTNLDNVSIAGVTTFAGNIDADGNLDLLGHLDIDGHTELDNLNVTGVSTFSGNLNLTGDIISNLTITSTDDGSAAAPEFKLFRNSATPADADYLGQIKFAGESDTGVERNYAKITGKILDASNGTEDGIIEFAHIKAGSQTITARFRSDSFQLLNDTNLTVSGDSTFTGNIDANGDLDVDGHTNLDNVSVAGITTFAGAIDANDNVDIAGILDVDGHTELDNVAISGVTTFSGAVDANANVDIAGVLDVDGHTELDNVAISGVTTFSGYLDANANVGIAGNLDVDGHTDLDNVSISGVTTFTGAIDANSNVDVAGTLDVDGHTELDNVNASGIVTATGFVGPITGNVTGTATTATKVEVTQSGGQADHYVMLAPSGSGDSAVRLDTGIRFHTGTNSLTLGGATVVGAGLSVVGVSTFTGDIDSNGRIVGAATSNLIPFLYSTFEDLPNASTYHGAFAHAHNRGKGYFAHSSNWYELVNKELNGTVGTGTERYDIGYIDAAGSNVTGVSTAATSQAATLNVGAGGTVLTASVDTSKVGINSTAPAYALDVVGDINSSTDIKVNGVSIVPSGGAAASLDDVVALAIALG